MYLLRWFQTIPLRLRSLLRRDQVEKELDEEIRYHVEREIEQLIAKGFSLQEARQATMRAFGGVEQRKEEIRDTRRVHLIEDIIQDLKYAARALWSNPGFTVVAVLSLALGIGGSTAVFSVVDPLLIKKLAVRNPQELIVFTRITGDGSAYNGFSYSEFRSFKDRLRTVAGVLTSLGSYTALMKVDGANETESVNVERVSSNFFALLGVEPVIGRTFIEGDDSAGAPDPVVIISHRLWQRRFGGSSDVIDKPITLNDVSFRIAGVAPQGFKGLDVADPQDMWWSLNNISRIPASRSKKGGLLTSGNLQVMGRLGADADLRQARLETNAIFTGMLNEAVAEHPDQRESILAQRIDVQSGATGWEESLRRRFTKPLGVLMAAVTVVFLIACANVAGLLLARGTARRKELTLRLAIGSGRFRLIRQLVTESIALASLGGTFGILLAYWGSRVLVSYAPEKAVALDVSLNVRVLGFTIALSLFSAILFGLVPALRSTRIDLISSLKETPCTLGRVGLRWSANNLIVVSQLALSMVLLVAGAFFLRTLENLRHVDTGFERKGLVLYSVNRGPNANRRSPGEWTSVLQQAVQQIEAISGVQSASILANSGLLGGNYFGTDCESDENPPKVDTKCSYMFIAPRFFETISTSMASGREFLSHDGESGRDVVIINEALARYLFGDENPLGRKVNKAEIVGVVKNTKHSNLREEAQHTMYFPFSRVIPDLLSIGSVLVVRTSIPPAGLPALSAAAERSVQQLDGQLTLANGRTMDDVAEATLANERTMARFVGLYSLTALLLACIGLYGTMSYTVAQRSSEVAIRMALGATVSTVLGMMMRETGFIIGAGMVVGLFGSLAAAQSISSFLFGLSPTDAETIAGATALLVVAAVAAAYLPARRASHIDPMEALRHE
jgi:predicted permease